MTRYCTHCRAQFADSDCFCSSCGARRALPVVEGSHVGGEIGVLGLGSWWLTALTEDQREAARLAYRSSFFLVGGGEGPEIDRGDAWGRWSTSYRLAGLAQLLSPIDRARALEIGERAFTAATSEPAGTTDRHFALGTLITLFAGDWQTPKVADRWEAAARAQVAIGAETAAALRAEEDWPTFPSHPGYSELVDLAAELAEVDVAVALCRQAEQEGWSGPWELRSKQIRLDAMRCRRGASPKPAAERELELEVIEDTLTRSETDLQRHYAFQGLIEDRYRERDRDPDALADAMTLCRRQIAMAPAAASSWRAQLTTGEPDRLPNHKGYQQLAIVLEREKRYAETIALCEQAQAQGWAGDWDKRIDRCRRKAGS